MEKFDEGEYYLKFDYIGSSILSEIKGFTIKDKDTNENSSSVNPLSGKTDLFSIHHNETIQKNAGLLKKYKTVIKGKVWIDDDGDGLIQSDEPSQINVNIALYDKNTNNQIQSTFSDENGEYIFNIFDIGKYYLKFNYLPVTDKIIKNFTKKIMPETEFTSCVNNEGISEIIEIDTLEISIIKNCGLIAEVFKDNEAIFEYTGRYKAVDLDPGIYQFECWGASGGYGSGNINYRGFGGYSKGKIEFINKTTIFIYVGEYGGDGINEIIGFNGGAPSSSIGKGHDGGRGGGASDIRLIGGNWDDVISLRSRLIVAGAGGGSQPTCGGYSSPGHGGGLIGNNSKNPTGTYAGAESTGGSQTSGGTGNRNPIANGSFGKGAICRTCGAGSGGGYYGGGSCYTAGGAGGSSFISGYNECNAVDINGEHTNQSIHYSGLYFTEGEMTVGINDGNGRIRITIL